MAKQKTSKKPLILIGILLIAIIILSIIAMLTGSSNMSVSDCIKALFKSSSNGNNRIIWNIRIPRILAAILAGAGLSVAGLIMQTCLNNPMASPSTLGVSNAAVFGANLSIIVFAGGFLNTGNNLNQYGVSANPYATSLMAFIFSVISILLVLGLCRIRNFSPNTVVLSGIALGSVWTAATTILQFYATDVGLSAAVIWNFGDLGRATYRTDGIMAGVIIISLIVFFSLAWKYNGLLSGDTSAASLGINVNLIRFISLGLASVITAVCVSYLGIIGFVGVICPHIVKKLIGEDHRFTIIASALMGSFLLILADTVSRSIGSGSALPVGAITTLLGAPFFLVIIFTGRKKI